MFTSIKTKEVILNQDDILLSNLFLYIEKNLEEKIVSYIRDNSYEVWEIKDESGLTILHKSCFLNNTTLSISIIREMKKRLGLCDKFTSFINSKTNEGLTPLHYTAFKGNIEISKYLLQNGADVNAVTNLGKNIIHLAAEGDQPAFMIYYLYKKVIDISSQDNNKSTPLHWACYSGAIHSIKFLINLGAEINAMDKNELTPLHLAVLNNRKEIVIKLLQNGAIKDMTNTRGETPLYIAWKKKYKDIYNILNKNEFYPLWSIEEPYIFIEPNDIYKKYIICMFVFQQVFIILMILPFLRFVYDIYINNILFVIDIILFIILIKREPGYKKTDIKKIKENSLIPLNKYPLMNQIERNMDIKQYCPVCFVPTLKGIKHCIICKKCVSGFSHHCFWINKCIGEKNILIYFIFILATIIYGLHCIYICLLSLFEFDFLKYDTFIYRSIFNTIKERQLRVFFASLIGTFSLFASFPLFFLLFNEIFKFFKNIKCCNKKESQKKTRKKINLDINDKNVELETKSLILDDDDNDNDLSINNINSIGINRDTFEESKGMKIDENDIFRQNSKNEIESIPQTPIIKEKNNLLFDSFSEE